MPLLKNECVEMGDPAPPHRRTHGGTGAGVLALVKPQATYNFDSALLYATVLCGSAFSVMFFLAIRAIELWVVRWETGVTA
jgi:ABC-type nitrate/sulfonate/bicarbonate transport system permease component